MANPAQTALHAAATRALEVVLTETRADRAEPDAALNLQDLVERYGPVDPSRAVHFLRQTSLSLAEAHEQGLVHRDIKPSNIVAARMGVTVDYVKVLDFGLVKVTQNAAEPESLLLTSPNVTTGTPAFMAPEVALGKDEVTYAADIYSLGCVAFWLLTGTYVFDAPNSIDMLVQHVINRYGHCAFTLDEELAAFAELVAWAETLPKVETRPIK